ncbi:hypothetical protein ACFQLX_13700 [Streptomyces polyrhachis]|uniref:Uncharacterized protein n=1 Tax=Streptomyces polyrhachis TaxID=1282885 RepID=A0ABW2GI40_9ACTN
MSIYLFRLGQWAFRRRRLVLAVMALAKSTFWYHPQWFATYVPHPDIEGEKLTVRRH